METLEFKASMDTLAKIITLGVVILLVAIGQSSFRTLLKFNDIDFTTILIHSGILLLFVAILLGSYLYSPQKYEIQDAQLIIKRPIGDKAVNITEITEIRKIKKGEISGTIRTFGVGGLFGYYGKFLNSTFGHMTYYVTQRKNMILLKTKAGKKIIISPDDINLADRLEELKSND